MRQNHPTGWQTHWFVINFSPCSADVCHSRHVRLSHAFQIAEVQDGAAIQGLIHQGLYLSHMGHSGGRVRGFSCWKRTLAQIPRCIYQQSCKERVGPGKLKLKSLIKEIVHPKIHPRAILDVDEFVSSSEQIWKNVALCHLLTYGSSAVNGCRRNLSSNS